MVREWIVKSGVKAVHFRKQPVPDSSEQNVLGMLKAGDSVYGEFLHIRRASREAGFVKIGHVEQQGGSKWLVAGAVGGNALLTKHPTEAAENGNAVGYALDGELVDGEFLFCMRRGEKRGGYVKVKHLKPVKARQLRAEPPVDQEEMAQLAAGLRAPSVQRWAVMDPGHDGAWLRREPSSSRSPENVVCLVPNGAVVEGEFLQVHGPHAGCVLFKDVEQQGPKAWRVLRATRLRSSLGDKELGAGEMLEGEYVFVTYLKRGKHQAGAAERSASQSDGASRERCAVRVPQGVWFSKLGWGLKGSV
ncbi:unnamed protein product [Effrenium voratum]|nr:unnamed protein product [Effrenium voratum]